MDPLSHIVAGRAVTALFDNGGRGPGLGAAAILGALAPDVDLLLAPAGWDIYLRAHQAGTHSIAGGLLVACASASLVRGLARGSRYAPLAAAAGAGAMSHLALDVVSGARTRLAWPFADTPAALPLVAMADPWLVAIFIVGLLALWPGRQRLHRVAPFMLGAVVGFLCLKGALLDRALRRSHLDPALPRAVEARWGSLTEWEVFDRTPVALRAWRISSRGGPATERLSRGLPPESALVTASRSLDTVKNFLHAHELGFPVEAIESEGRTAVRWSDLRYCTDIGDRDAAITCRLWFGGVFGPDGRALIQEVTVGTWKQTRAAPR
jgi:membrane-bound metal-dependent hydrolase YbcI (DUF457 family)